MLDSQVQLMNLSWDIDFEVFTLRESISPKDFLLDSRTGSNIDKFSQAKFIIENDCPDLEKLNSQLSFYETLVSAIPALAPTEGQVNIPDFIQDLYRLKNNQK